MRDVAWCATKLSVLGPLSRFLYLKLGFILEFRFVLCYFHK